MNINRTPNFVIIGAAKSASTWLHLALRQHPSIFMPEGESRFFEDPFYIENDISLLRGEINSAPADAVIGIKCPNYLCTPECAPRLAKALPNARLIAILRNPVERAVSQYYHLIRSGRLPVAPADEAFSRYLAGDFDPPYAKRLVMEFGLYAKGIENYWRVYPKDQLLVISDLDLRGDSRAVYKRACRFLSVTEDFVPPNVSMRRNQGVYFSPFLSFIKVLNQVGLKFDPQTGLESARRGFVGSAARHLAVFGSRISAATRIFVRDQEPAVSNETKAALLGYYTPDIVKLEAMMNLDLSHWKVLRRA